MTEDGTSRYQDMALLIMILVILTIVITSNIMSIRNLDNRIERNEQRAEFWKTQIINNGTFLTRYDDFEPVEEGEIHWNEVHNFSEFEGRGKRID